MKKQLAAVTLFLAVLAAMTIAAAAGKTTATIVGGAEYESVDFAAFNKTVAEAAGKSEAWTMDPVLVALKLAGPSEGMTQNIERVYASAESPDAAEVMITNEKLPDDSVMGVRYIIVLGKNEDGSWTVKSAGRAVSCHEGRGHQDYSKEPCM